MSTRADLLAEVQAEMEVAFARYGEQNHPSFSPADEQPQSFLAAVRRADELRAICDRNTELGILTYADIWREEVAEAEAERLDPEQRILELIQVAAVSLAWVESIRRNELGKTDDP